jgi:dolichol-phosphate mannosyltransferase
MAAQKRISICIPIFNEAENLPVAVSKVEELFRGKLPEYELEIVITDNASTDGSWVVAHALAATRPYLHAYRFSRNFGYQNSIFAGLSMATGDAVVELDADLEDPPAVIEEFVRLWEDGVQVAYGVRRRRFAAFHLRFLFWLYYKFLRRISSLDIPANSGDFRLMDRKVVNVLKHLPERNLYLRGLVTHLGFRQAPVVYDRHPRLAGSSKFRMIHYITLAIDGITAVSKTPLRAIGVLGFLLFAASVLLGAYYFGGAMLNKVPVQGFTTIVVLMLLLHGLNFIFVGVIGEYLSRVFDDSKGRPRVIIADSINGENTPESL